MYANGYGVVRDYGEAAVLFEQATAQGHANAQFGLGTNRRCIMLVMEW